MLIIIQLTLANTENPDRDHPVYINASEFAAVHAIFTAESGRGPSVTSLRLKSGVEYKIRETPEAITTLAIQAFNSRGL